MKCPHDSRGDVYFIHFNHSTSPGLLGGERRQVLLQLSHEGGAAAVGHVAAVCQRVHADALGAALDGAPEGSDAFGRARGGGAGSGQGCMHSVGRCMCTIVQRRMRGRAWRRPDKQSGRMAMMIMLTRKPYCSHVKQHTPQAPRCYGNKAHAHIHRHAHAHA